jgi:hypothetical protein
MLKELNTNQLLELARSAVTISNCEKCSALSCKGWESMPSGFDAESLIPLGTLKIEGAQESWDEYHPDGTNQWSSDAPISAKHYPYNRSDVFECKSCQRKFLRYTEYGGYYLDERIRELNPDLITSM